MRIGQIVLDGASPYERKSQRVDAAALAAEHQVTLVSIDDVTTETVDVVHVYGPEELPRRAFIGFPLPYVASGRPRAQRWFGKPRQPGYVVAPIETEGADLLPEAVEENYFSSSAPGADEDTGAPRKRIGTFARADVTPMVQQTLARLHRFRDDIEWSTFSDAPSPDDLSQLDLWVDPAAEANDYDGFVAEAVAAGVGVVASRTPVNAKRLEQGRIGFLVPPRDPNELAHAILAALFKTDVAHQKRKAARQTAAKFRPRQRLRVLAQMYENVTR